jgi:DNA-binding transcriptional ArsR family regulator
VAAAIGDPARAAMLSALMGGVPLAAGELARRASVSASTASGHLARLVEARLVRRRTDGRHRYYALAGEEVAAALEALARVAAGAGSTKVSDAGGAAFRFARTCYDHLAGSLGVRLTDSLLERGLIAGAGFDVTEAGERWLRSLDIDVAALRTRRRALTRPCMDWSERRDHLAGSVGAAVASTMLDRRWLVRIDGTRALRLTLRGREGLYRWLPDLVPHSRF